MAIFRWYRLLSPKIQLTIHSISFDKDAEILYVNLNQIFAVWFIPFYKADVHLVTVLTLTTDGAQASSRRRPGLQYSDVAAGKRPKYYITTQEDYYQANDVVNFFLPGLGPFLCRVGQHIGTIACVIGAVICDMFLRMVFGSNRAASSFRSHVTDRLTEEATAGEE
ncbi:uncharacterized protein DNG_07409 [Cephalotrichum gorgonifer]|uniref:SigF-like NTF2-like domain-containing protein n=1 Tax=Cephalotrichum gorgonifer TaxID=2041049 RepID=A0AAE8SXG5_9PEZI|nr:uncharacterized protein DNG_07409 [Cephalotrichum gorgonifer]